MKIEVKELTKEFKDSKVLDNISLEFVSGKIYGIYGRNGAGKSVFLKILCGFLMPTKGKVLIDGIDYNNNNNFPKDLRALIEKPNFFPDLTGFENLKLLANIQKKIAESDIIKTLDIVNLESEKNKKYNKYSLGMKQKLGIAQVIMEDPKIMILDEPFNGIEEETVKKLIDYFKQIKKDKIIIISTHIKEDLELIADVTYKFDNGKVNK